MRALLVAAVFLSGAVFAASPELTKLDRELSEARTLRDQISAKPDDYERPEETIRVLDETITQLETARARALARPSAGPAAGPSAAPAGKAKPVAPKPSALSERRAAALKELESRIKDAGASAAAKAELRRVLRDLLAGVDPAVIERMNAAKLSILLAPEGKAITDLKELAKLKGTKTKDGRLWETVNGVANVELDDGTHVTALRADMVTGKGYPKGFLAYHELGHSIHVLGGDAATKAKINRVFNDIMARPAPASASKSRLALDKYAETDDRELFGQATAAYFNTGQYKEDRKLLQKKEPELYKVLADVYHPTGGKKP